MVTKSKNKKRSIYSGEPLWFKVLWFLSSGEYLRGKVDKLYVGRSGRIRSITRNEKNPILQSQIEWAHKYMSRSSNKNVSGIYSFLLDDPNSNTDYNEKYSFHDLMLEAFPDSNPIAAKTKLSGRKGLEKALERTGGVYFITIESGDEDLRSKMIGIDDELLREWLNNLFNYYIQTKIPEFYYFFQSDKEKTNIFDLIKIHQRVILRYAIAEWKAKQFPPKDHLAKRIFDFVAIQLMGEYKFKKDETVNPIIKSIYDDLIKMYGPQGWYPLTELMNTKPVNITKSGSLSGYHPNDYTYPRTDDQRFEVCIGAITTQSTSWIQVEKALLNLKKKGALNVKKMKELPINELEEAIKPAGYYKQKAKKIKEFTKFYLKLNGKTPTRKDLLYIWGIGPETADSILLYAFKVPEFVVDAYTVRIFTNLGLIKEKNSYGEVKWLFESNLQPPDLIIYQEYHALIVEHAKRYYRKKEDMKNCPLYLKYVKKRNINN